MKGAVYLNGKFVTPARAHVSVEDRGFMLGDGVYEVVRYYRGRPFAMPGHVARLRKSLEAVRIRLDASAHDLAAISDELVTRNALPDAQVYWQVTRGVAPRKHLFPGPEVAPTVLALCYAEPPLEIAGHVRTLSAITRPDMRWKRCAIKSINLLPNLLDSQAAHEAGADTAILVRNGVATECPSRTLFLVERGALVTYPLDGTILDSITRRIVLEIAQAEHITVREERPAVKRLFAAQEVLVVGTTTEIAAVTQIDGRRIGLGAPGELARKLQRAYVARVWRECGFG
ncbi:MAG: aminotransferase class IV [Planctomycetes bacterium]|nr:aminotransferase class IV [Planctomycetota bacterium]